MEYVGLSILEEVGPPQKQTVCITECQWYMAVTITVEHDTTDDKVNKQKIKSFSLDLTVMVNLSTLE